MAKLDWSKPKTEKQMRGAKAYEIESERRRRLKYSSYHHGQFSIGGQVIPKWHPKRDPVPAGIVFNSLSGRFEAYQDGAMLTSIPWKIDWRLLANWKAGVEKQFDLPTPKFKPKTITRKRK